MVGRAYSLDFKLGYRYIIIRAYDCDDLSFVTPSMAYRVYRVERKNLKTELVLPGSDNVSKRLSLRHITNIVQMLTLEEYKHFYPVELSWEITPSGECISKNTDDIYSAWPIIPTLIESDVPYINITDLCYKDTPCYFEVSFLCEVLNEVANLCGIYDSELFVVCGNQLYCSVAFKTIERKLFASDIICSLCGEFEGFATDILPQKVLDKIQNLKFAHNDSPRRNAECITSIKRECIEKICQLVSDCINNKSGLKSLAKHLRLTVAKAVRELKCFGSELISTSASLSTDINYLFFDEVLEAFTFADSMRDISKKIRLNRQRYRRLKELKKPMFIYKGKLYTE